MPELRSKANQDIRDQIKDSPVYNYEVAETLGITDNYFNALLRHPLGKDKRAIVEKAIKKTIDKKQESAKAGASK